MHLRNENLNASTLNVHDISATYVSRRNLIFNIFTEIFQFISGPPVTVNVYFTTGVKLNYFTWRFISSKYEFTKDEVYCN